MILNHKKRLYAGLEAVTGISIDNFEKAEQAFYLEDKPNLMCHLLRRSLLPPPEKIFRRLFSPKNLNLKRSGLGKRRGTTRYRFISRGAVRDVELYCRLRYSVRRKGLASCPIAVISIGLRLRNHGVDGGYCELKQQIVMSGDHSFKVARRKGRYHLFKRVVKKQTAKYTPALPNPVMPPAVQPVFAAPRHTTISQKPGGWPQEDTVVTKTKDGAQTRTLVTIALSPEHVQEVAVVNSDRPGPE